MVAASSDQWGLYHSCILLFHLSIPLLLKNTCCINTIIISLLHYDVYLPTNTSPSPVVHLNPDCQYSLQYRPLPRHHLRTSQ
jgi:hypothetical protein